MTHQSGLCGCVQLARARTHHVAHIAPVHSFRKTGVEVEGIGERRVAEPYPGIAEQQNRVAAQPHRPPDHAVVVVFKPV